MTQAQFNRKKLSKFYFEHTNSEFCFNKSYFIEQMKLKGIKEMTVYKADRDDIDGYFFCKEYNQVGETGNCGRGCMGYIPRNGQSGSCRFYSKALYANSGEPLIIRV